ncbi:MAG: hypothetical protein IK057_06580 [Clostridia bacterium]|nr:hypothetical protein [Clostridia bacterium]
MLLFYNFDFERIHAEPKVKSISWTLYFNQIGTFEAHFPLSSELTEITAENRYLAVCDGEKSAIITGREVTDELILYGRTPNWLLEKRIAPKAESITQKAGIICNNLVTNAFSDVTDFAVSNPPESTEITAERTTLSTVYDAVKGYLSEVGLGHKLDFDAKNRRWSFSVIEGSQIPLLISESNKNAYETSVCEDILDLADCGYYGEDGYIAGEQEGICRWETVLSAETEAEATAQLSEKKNKSEILLKLRGLKFGVDYNLGDKLRIQITKGKWRTTEKRTVSGVRLLTKNGFFEEVPIFTETGGI